MIDAKTLPLYFNQARVLDKNNFNTFSMMPQLLANAPSNFDGGRTYPYLGAAMLLPLKAPYTDPTTATVCGSATQENVGLKTCVSITPKVPNAQWVVEQMAGP